MRRFVRWFADAGGTVFLSSHLLGEVAAVADDLVVIHHGRLAAAGPVDELVPGDTDLESVFHHLIRSHRRTGSLVMRTLLRIELYKLRTTPALWVALAVTLVLALTSTATTILVDGAAPTPVGSTGHVSKALSSAALTSVVMLAARRADHRGGVPPPHDHADLPRSAAARPRPRGQARDRGRAGRGAGRGDLRPHLRGGGRALPVARRRVTAGRPGSASGSARSSRPRSTGSSGSRSAP